MILQTWFIKLCLDYELPPIPANGRQEIRRIETRARLIGCLSAYLALTNLAWWVMDLYGYHSLTDHISMYESAMAYYGDNAWKLMGSLMYPLVILYRFTSASLFISVLFECATPVDERLPRPAPIANTPQPFSTQNANQPLV